MKKIIYIIFAVMLITLNFTVVSANSNVSIVVNGNLVEFADGDVKPTIYDNRVYVPIRKTCEYLGIDVQYNANEGKMYFIKGSNVVSHVKGTSAVEVNGQYVYFDTPSLNINGSTLMPIRMLAESLGTTVTWDDPTKTVYIDVVSNSNNAINSATPESNIENYQYTMPIPEYSEEQYQQDLDLYYYRKGAEMDSLNKYLDSLQKPTE